MKRILLLGFIALFTLMFTGCETLSRGSARNSSFGERYTSYNLWYEHPQKLYSINYKKGSIIPAGSKVTDINVGRSAITFKVVDTG